MHSLQPSTLLIRRNPRLSSAGGISSITGKSVLSRCRSFAGRRPDRAGLPGRQAAERYRRDGSDAGLFGFACGEFGKRLPVLGKLGAAAICATFIPSALVHYGLLPEVVVESTTKFYKSTNILYLYICCIIVGSIMSMNRTTLIQGFLRIFFPMLCGEIVGMLVGVGVGTALGLEPFQVFSLSSCRSWPVA